MRRLSISDTDLPAIEAALAKEKSAHVVRWLLGMRLVAMQRTYPQATAERNVSDREVRRWAH